MKKKKNKHIRTFKLVRAVDVSGISGTGVVAEGVEFTGSKVALHWLGDVSTVELFDNIEALIDIHGHDGSTNVVYDRQRKKST